MSRRVHSAHLKICRSLRASSVTLPGSSIKLFKTAGSGHPCAPGWGSEREHALAISQTEAFRSRHQRGRMISQSRFPFQLRTTLRQSGFMIFTSSFLWILSSALLHRRRTAASVVPRTAATSLHGDRLYRSIRAIRTSGGMSCKITFKSNAESTSAWGF